MTGAEVAKSFFLTIIILTALAGGIMLLPVDARYLRASYCFATAIALFGYVVAAKPQASWARSNLWWLGTGMAIIGLMLVFGA